MLQYDWGSSSSNNSQPVPTIHETGSYEPDPTARPIYHHHDPFNPPHFHDMETHFISPLNQFHNPQQNHQATHHHHYFSPSTTMYGAYPPLTLEPAGFPKPEPMVSGFEWGGGSSNYSTDNNSASSCSRLGLNLGGRTFYAEEDFVNRLYRRSRMLEPGSVNAPRCQAEGCNADLSYAKHYHKRHKVCEFHSKAATVVANGLTQRFCQQCSRFHQLSEFDNGKRSCRKRLADHNRRRRKSQQPNQECNNKNNSNNNNNNNDDDDNTNKSQLDQNNNATHSSSENAPRSPPYSKAHSSSVTIAISPPRISLNCFGHRSYNNDNGTPVSNSSTSFLFYSNG